MTTTINFLKCMHSFKKPEQIIPSVLLPLSFNSLGLLMGCLKNACAFTLVYVSDKQLASKATITRMCIYIFGDRKEGKIFP